MSYFVITASKGLIDLHEVYYRDELKDRDYGAIVRVFDEEHKKDAVLYALKIVVLSENEAGNGIKAALRYAEIDLQDVELPYEQELYNAGGR